jgi:hypothetical protein
LIQLAMTRDIIMLRENCMTTRFSKTVLKRTRVIWMKAIIRIRDIGSSLILMVHLWQQRDHKINIKIMIYILVLCLRALTTAVTLTVRSGACVFAPGFGRRRRAHRHPDGCVEGRLQGLRQLRDAWGVFGSVLRPANLPFAHV